MPSASTICSLAKLTFWRSMDAIRESSPRKGIRRREILPISCFSTIIGSPWVCLFVLVAGRRRPRVGGGGMHSSRHLSGVAGGSCLPGGPRCWPQAAGASARLTQGPQCRCETLDHGHAGRRGALRRGAGAERDTPPPPPQPPPPPRAAATPPPGAPPAGLAALRRGAVVDGDARARAEQAFAVAQQVFHALHHEDDGRQHLAVLAFGVRFVAA